MCYPVTCKQCGKTTWAGCGQHVAMVKAGVPADQWCPGEHTADEMTSVAPSGSFFSKLLG